MEELGPLLDYLVLIGRKSVVFFEPTLGDGVFLKEAAERGGEVRRIGPEGEVMVFAIPLSYEGETKGHLCVVFHVALGYAALWLLPARVTPAASSESDLLIWMLLKKAGGEPLSPPS